MTSLTDVYEGNAREVSSPRRLYAGTGLVVVGAVLAVLGVVVATTDLFASTFGTEWRAVEWAGVLAGVGVPAALLGVFIVLPASNVVRAAAAIGSSFCLFGVALFWDAYPYHWRGNGDDLTFLVSAVYLLGLFVALWCLFVGVVNFKTRNDPGGMLEMNVTRKGETRIVEVENDGGGGLGGVGFLGSQPDGEVETQTNAPGAGRSGNPVGPRPTSDGGTVSQDITSPMDASGGRDAEIVDSPSSPNAGATTDRYCGNCRHFTYQRSSAGMTPYCGRFDEPMDDMDACEEWAPNHD